MKIVCGNRKECPEGKWCKDGAKKGCSKFFPMQKIDWSEMFERGKIFWPRLVRAKGSEITIRTKLPEAKWVNEDVK